MGCTYNIVSGASPPHAARGGPAAGRDAQPRTASLTRAPHVTNTPPPRSIDSSIFTGRPSPPRPQRARGADHHRDDRAARALQARPLAGQAAAGALRADGERGPVPVARLHAQVAYARALPHAGRGPAPGDLALQRVRHAGRHDCRRALVRDADLLRPQEEGGLDRGVGGAAARELPDIQAEVAEHDPGADREEQADRGAVHELPLSDAAGAPEELARVELEPAVGLPRRRVLLHSGAGGRQWLAGARGRATPLPQPVQPGAGRGTHVYAQDRRAPLLRRARQVSAQLVRLRPHLTSHRHFTSLPLRLTLLH